MDLEESQSEVDEKFDLESGIFLPSFCLEQFSNNRRGEKLVQCPE